MMCYKKGKTFYNCIHFYLVRFLVHECIVLFKESHKKYLSYSFFSTTFKSVFLKIKNYYVDCIVKKKKIFKLRKKIFLRNVLI